MAEQTSAQVLDAAAAARLTEFARVCKAAVRAVSLYPAEHPTITATLRRLVDTGGRTTATGALVVTVLPDNLLVDGRATPRPDPAVAELGALLHRHLIGGFVLHGGADAESWRTLLLLLARVPEEVRADGGIKHLWTTAGGAHVEIQEIDYAEMLREGQGADAATLDAIIAGCLKDSLELDESTLSALRRILDDPENLTKLMAQIQEQAAASGAEVQASAVLRMLRGVASLLAQASPAEAAAGFDKLAAAMGQLSADVMMNLLQQRGTPQAMVGSTDVVGAAADRMSDDTVAQFVAGSVIADGGASGRLAEAFQALVPELERKRQLLSLAEHEVADSPMGQEEGFSELWKSAEQMLTSYSDEPYVSQAYGRELSRARTQAVEVERTGDDPPERIEAWLSTVGDSVLQGLDLQLLLDLLSIEADPHRWRDVADTVALQVGDLVRAGQLEPACQLVEAIARETEGTERSKQAFAQAALEHLTSGPLIKHALGHLRSDDEMLHTQIRRLCNTLGPIVVSPLAEVLSAEPDAGARKRLRDILIGFGARGRAAVQPLLNSANWEVRQTAAVLLREFGGTEGLPELESLLNDHEPRVQQEAIRALMLISDKRTYEILTRVLVANKSHCRETLVEQLSTRRDARAAPLCCYLIQHIDHRAFQDVYVAAVEALAVGGDGAVEALRTALYRGEWWAPYRTRRLRSAAARALRKTKMPEALEALREASTRGPRGVRAAARAQLALLAGRR